MRVFLDTLSHEAAGLDSANALRIIKCLRTLAHERNLTIVFSIHQPDSALYAVRVNGKYDNSVC